ncbi:hypothetical protein DVH24_013147 [Malus domestica]|uniref:Uncharacterized protein n=1 Tax=Malus domestica TaxID=3750 RepID=A0A498IPM0_MALDO|nr:hypothetical protein DVH24_013147 [Malus domestica]
MTYQTNNKPLSPSLCRGPWPHLHVACCPPPKIQEPRRSIPPKLKLTPKSSSPRHTRPPFFFQCSNVLFSSSPSTCTFALRNLQFGLLHLDLSECLVGTWLLDF